VKALQVEVEYLEADDICGAEKGRKQVG